jgi:hypothetical protein
MSLSTKAQATVKAKWEANKRAAQVAATTTRKPADPIGMTAREVAVAMGRPDRKGIARIAAVLSKVWQYGKLDRDEIDGLLRYKPNAHTGIDFRVTTRTPTGKTTRPAILASVQPKASPARKAVPPPRKPSPEQVAKVTSLFAKPTPRNRSAGPMLTSEDFIAAGGVIEKLPPGASSRKPHIFADEDTFTL